MMGTVQLHNLSIGYKTKGDTKCVASELNGEIRRGELTCLLGKNGVGKSTLLRTLSAFQPALSGDILLMDQFLAACSDKELSQMIGVVLTEKPHVRNMTVAELVGLGRSPYTGFWGMLSDEDHQIIRESMRLTGIEPLESRMIQTLSDGERQKVMIAKALAQQTPLIFLDEPTAFLDYPSKIATMQLLRRLAHEQGKLIVLSTHDLEIAFQIADRLWLLQQSGLQTGTLDELSESGVISAFLDSNELHYDVAQRRMVLR